jgi:UDP-glucose/GDP-mannose dehydrogenase family, central domain
VQYVGVLPPACNTPAMLTDRMGIDIWEVVDAASTKPYGFMRFEPGPGMGGHCLPVDPFYLSRRAREFDMTTEFIELAGKINQQMPYHCVAKVQRALNDAGHSVKGSRIALLGVSYKPGVGDIRSWRTSCGCNGPGPPGSPSTGGPWRSPCGGQTLGANARIVMCAERFQARFRSRDVQPGQPTSGSDPAQTCGIRPLGPQAEGETRLDRPRRHPGRGVGCSAMPSSALTAWRRNRGERLDALLYAHLHVAMAA